ncbi:hypothetical protein V2G26_008473 [Clonostachys chloroleuca]
MFPIPSQLPGMAPRRHELHIPTALLAGVGADAHVLGQVHEALPVTLRNAPPSRLAPDDQLDGQPVLDGVAAAHDGGEVSRVQEEGVAPVRAGEDRGVRARPRDREGLDGEGGSVGSVVVVY